MSANDTIHEVFTSIAARYPDRPAIVADDAVLCYTDLAAASDRVASYLQSRGVAGGGRVGLYSARSLDAIVAMLGILKAGAAYVPFDPAYPVPLLKFVHGDCAPSLLLAEQALLATEQRFWSGEAVDIREAMAGSERGPAAMHCDPATPAYVMYTSGSTGQPKGVIVPHRGVVRLCVDNSFAVVGPSEVHLQLAPLAFDASTFEIWGALLNGGTVAVLASAYPSLDDIARAIERHGVTTAWLTAGVFHLMVDHQLDALKPLRQLLAGGDVLSPPHVAKAVRALPGTQLINGYGPTENTTFTCCYQVPREWDPSVAVPIGRPIAQTNVYVLDETGSPVIDGEAGELYAGGAGVALGYLNRPDLTAERFLPNSFLDDGLMYRTGDRVRRRADGNIEFLGRFDRQIKINGKRVELDEIEAWLRRHPRVDEATAISRSGDDGIRQIIAYVKSNDDAAVMERALREFLREQLPDYMIPAWIIVMRALPLTPIGKIDRAKLPLPEEIPVPKTQAGRAVATVDPASSLEQILIDVWRGALGRSSIGLHDNFFDLGGTSLQLVKIQAKLREIMKRDISVVELFEFPKISALAAHLSGSAESVSRPLSTAEDRAQRRRTALSRARPSARRDRV